MTNSPIPIETAYGQTLARLFAARRFGITRDHAAMHALLSWLGQPQAQLGSVVTVAGTNGKGSTVAMLAALLCAQGHTVATYTSPHLITVRERMMINGHMISEAEFVEVCRAVHQAGAALGLEATFFEQLTAAAIYYFASRRPRFTLLEVGLGGRLDSTNAIEPALAVITGVDFDHQAVLGDRIESIAQEKAGIMRAGRPVIIGQAGVAYGRECLWQAAHAIGAVAIDAPPVPAALPLRLAGEHQRANAGAALAAVAALGLPADPWPLATSRVHHPGRLELIAASPAIILDGAHNPGGAHALCQAIGVRPGPRVLVFAASADKAIKEMVDELAPAFEAVVATRYQQERSASPEQLAVTWQASGVRVELAENVAAALERARVLAGTTGTVVVAGSLFLVGEARAIILGLRPDPMGISDPAPFQVGRGRDM